MPAILYALGQRVCACRSTLSNRTDVINLMPMAMIMIGLGGHRRRSASAISYLPRVKPDGLFASGGGEWRLSFPSNVVVNELIESH